MTSLKTILFLSIMLFLSLFHPTHSRAEMKEDYSYLKLNTDIHFFNNQFLYSDSLSQRRISTYKNINFLDVNFDGVPIYSNFDGNYNLNFLNPRILKSIFENQYSISSRLIHNAEFDDTLATVIQLFSGTKNSKFDINHIGSKNHFFWQINPIFESMSKYAYSNKSTKNPFDLKKIENSGHQNISVFANAGYSNHQAQISIDSYFSNADLYVPNKLNENRIKTHFNDYNIFFGKFNFSNKFSPNFIISGNVFYKYNYRNKLESYDSLDYEITSITQDLSEYMYGASLSLEFPTLFEQNTGVSVFYAQGVEINYDLKKLYNLRMEDENLVFSIYQNIFTSDKLKTDIQFQYLQRNINLSEYGAIPSNKRTWNLFLDNQYIFSQDASLNMKIAKFSNAPFNSQYYEIYPPQIANLDLKPDNNYAIDLFYDRKVTDKIAGNVGLSFARTNNLICNVPIAPDTFQFQNYYSKTSLGINTLMNYTNKNFTVNAEIEYVISNFENDIQKLQPNILYPPFRFEIYGEYDFKFGLNTRINFVYSAGINSYNSESNKIEPMQNVFLTNIYFEQIFDKDRIYVVINNLTNEIYYDYFNLPNSGINFLMGVLLTF